MQSLHTKEYLITSNSNLEGKFIGCDHEQEKQQPKSYRYYRHKALTIQPINFDSSDNDNNITEQEQNTCLHSFQVEIPSPKVKDESKEQKRKKSKRKRLIQIEQKISFNAVQMASKWNFPSTDLPLECISILKRHKQQNYQEMLSSLTALLSSATSKKMILIYGQKQSGKKTLVFHALQQLKEHACSELNYFYLDFSSSLVCSKAQLHNLYMYLCKASQSVSTDAQISPHIFVINNFSAFYYQLKKNQIYHEFKNIVLKNRFFFVFIDLHNHKTKKQSWMQEYSKKIVVSSSSLNLLVDLLIGYMDHYTWPITKWRITRPLATFFCSKFKADPNFTLGIISKLKQFLLQQPEVIAQGKASQKLISRNLLQQFKAKHLSLTLSITIAQLNFHQKMILIALYQLLSEHSQVVVSYNELELRYQWVCQSLSLQPKNHKQFKHSLLIEMQTYQIIKLLPKSPQKNHASILLKIDLQAIEDVLGKQPLLSKFFKEKS